MGRPTHITAKQIYQELLDRIGSAYMRGDFGYFREVIHTPHHFVTRDGKHIVDDEEGLRRAFDSFRQYMISQQLTDFVRTCTEAAFASEEEIVGHHVSHLVRNGTRVQEPYTVTSILRRADGVWKVHASRNDVSDQSWPSLALKHGGTKSGGGQPNVGS